MKEESILLIEFIRKRYDEKIDHLLDSLFNPYKSFCLSGERSVISFAVGMDGE